MLNSEEIFNLHNEEDNKKEDDGDTIIIQLASNQIKVKFSQLCKYSQHIREEYRIKDAKETLTQTVIKYQADYDINENNIILFFKLINEEDVKIKGPECFELYLLAKKFKVNTLIQLLQKYSQNHSNDISFIINLLLKQNSIKNDQIIESDEISFFSELNLINQIDECLQHDDFCRLPISIIYRIFESRKTNEFSNDLLFDFINKSIEQRFILFHFLDVQKLSEKKLIELNEIRKTKPSQFFDFLRVDFNYYFKLRELNKDQKEQIDSLANENQAMQSKIKKIKLEKTQLKKENQKQQDLINSIQSKNQQLELKITKLTKKLDNLKEKAKIIADIPYEEDFKGILNFLKAKGNIFDKIEIKSSSVSYGRIPQNVVDFIDTTKEFCTTNEKNPWLRIDFKSYKLIPQSYTLRSNNWGEIDGAYLMGWVVEGSNDNVDYETINEQKNTSLLIGRNKTHTFKIDNHENKKFRYIQIRGTKNCGKCNYLALNAVEFNGTLVLD